MDELQLKILNTLKQACSDPIVTQSGDARLRAHLADIRVLAAHLQLELVDQPQLRRQTLAALTALAPEAERLLAARGADRATASRLAALDGGDAAQFDTALALVHDIQRALHRIGDAEAMALEKRFALAEGEYGKRRLQALAARKGAETAPPAGQTREFDPARLGDFIVRAFPEEKDLEVEDIRFISGGSSKYTMLIRLAGTRELPGELVLRGDSVSSAGYGGSSVTDEYRLLRVMYDNGVCVARPLAVEATGDVFGSPFMLVERRPGEMIGHMFLMPPRNPDTCRDIAAKLAAIHAVAPETIGDWMRGASVETSAQVAATLEESYRNWQALQRPSPLFESAFKWLRDNVAVMDRSRGLVHGDYGLNNILIDGGKVSAVLDWEFAHIGNPAYDLGYFHYMAEALGSWQEFLDAYVAAGGRTFSREELDYSILFAVVRLGVMVCQAEDVYRAGITDGMFIALTFGRNCHSQSLQRIHDLLDRVL